MKSWEGRSCRKQVRHFEMELEAAADGRALDINGNDAPRGVLPRTATEIDGDLNVWRIRLASPEPEAVIHHAGTPPTTLSEMDEEKLPDAIEALHKEMLLADTSGLSCNAEQFWLLAMGSLEQAKRFATLALYAQRQARVDR